MEEKSQPPPPNKTPESEEEQEKVIKLLEKRLEKHDKNRKIVQEKLTETLNKLTGQIDNLENRNNKELEEKFVFEEDRLQRALNKLCGNNTGRALREAKTELSVVQSYEIIENKKPNDDITTLCELKVERRIIPEDDHVGFAISREISSTYSPSNTTEKSETICDSDKFAEKRERLVKLLEERLQTHDRNREAVQNKLHEICGKLRVQIVELEDRVNKELEDKFTSEDNRLQAALNELRGNKTASALQKAKAELLVEQSYDVIENNFNFKHDLTTLCELKAERRIVPELMEMRKPTNVRVSGVNRGCVSVEFTCLNPDAERVLSDNTIVNPVKYKCLLFKKGNEQESKEYFLGKNEGNNSSSFFTFTPDTLEPETPYAIRVKIVTGDRESEWSDKVAGFTTPEFKECCAWKKCPGDVDDDRKYIVDGGNPRVATKINGDDWCTIIGSTHIPPNKVTSWNIKIQGVWTKERLRREYVHTRDSVGVVVDTTRGDLSFVLNGVNYGVAYCGIPLDKPLVPCVLLYHEGDSVELII